MSRYRDDGPRPHDDLAAIRVVAPRRGAAIILARPFCCNVHDVPMDPRDPKRGIRTNGCRQDVLCPLCSAGIPSTWRAYLPVWTLNIETFKGPLASSRRLVLTIKSNCFESLEAFAHTEAGELWWPGLHVEFRRGAHNELFSRSVGRIDESELPVRCFDVETVVLRSWGDPAASKRGQRGRQQPAIVPFVEAHGDQVRAIAPDAAPFLMSPDSALGMEEAHRRFDLLPEAERERWYAAARAKLPGRTDQFVKARAVGLWFCQLATGAG